MIETLTWVRIGIPEEREEMAREFYGELLGLEEADPPAAEPAPQGLWYRMDGGPLLRVEGDARFTPSHQTHPAFAVSDISAAAAHFAEHLFDVEWENDGVKAFYVYDPFGNRLAFRQRE